MQITSLNAVRFGPFQKIHLEFKPTGVNLISGPAAVGKTQAFGAILASLVGKPAISFDDSGAGPSSIELVIQENEQVEHLQVNFDMTSRGIRRARRTISTPSGEETTEVLGTKFRDELRKENQLVFWNTKIQPKESDLATIISIEESRFYRMLSPYLREEVLHALHTPNSIASTSIRSLSTLISTLVQRDRQGTQLPLLLDIELNALDVIGNECFWSLLEAASIGYQTIVFASTYNPNVHIAACLSAPAYRERSFVAYKYGYRPRPPVPHQVRRQKIQEDRRFILGEVFGEDESLTMEYKEIDGNNLVSKITDTAETYAVAYLNSEAVSPGKVVWGVRDSDHVIVGVVLSAKERDSIRKKVTNKLAGISPSIAPGAYRIEIIPTAGGCDSEEVRHIVVLTVPSASERLLYATGKGHVFLKTDSGKKKLTPLEVQRELIRRLSNGPVA